MAQPRKPRRPPVEAEILSGKVLSIGAKGDGVVDVGDRQIFAPYVAPGDEGSFSVTGDRGILLELTKEGSVRRQADCAHYGVCGGCALQHVAEDYYPQWKRELIVDALSRIGVAPEIVAPVRSTPVASRRRINMTVQTQRNRKIIGFNQRRSSQISEIDHCIVLRPALHQALPDLLTLANMTPASDFDLSVTLCSNTIDVEIRSRKFREPTTQWLAEVAAHAAASGFGRVSLNGEPVISLSAPFVYFGDIAALVPPGGFLQASEEGEKALIDLVLEGVGKARRVADLFCGSGAFSLPLAIERNVFAADASGSAIEALAKSTAGAQGAGKIRSPINVEARDLFERPLQPNELNAFDAVVFDPPRAGAAAQAATLALSSVPCVVAVSCNPLTFARDAALLIESGFTLEKVTPVDQFVYAAHVELVGVFQRAKKSKR